MESLKFHLIFPLFKPTNKLDLSILDNLVGHQ